MLLLNNHLNMHSQPDIIVKRVNVTLEMYSLEIFERENVCVAPGNHTLAGSALHTSGIKLRN